MLKLWFLAAIAGFALPVQAESWQNLADPVPLAIDISLLENDVLPMSVSGIGDLAPDPSFGAGGQANFELDGGMGRDDFAFRVFPRPGGGWYVAGNARNPATLKWDAKILSVGPDGSFETSFRVETPMTFMNDAAYDAATGLFYFAGAAAQPGFPDTDMVVTCLDTTIGSNGGPCPGWGSTGTQYVFFDQGGANNDGAAKIVVRPNLGVLISGWAQTDTGHFAVAAAALHRSSGLPVDRFGGNDNGKFTFDINPSETVKDIHVLDMALSNDADSAARLYIAGDQSRNSAGTDYDGFVVALNAYDGVLDPSFSDDGYRPIFMDLGTVGVNQYDAVTAITVQANGKLAVAGISIDPNLNERLMLTRLNANGSMDPTLCGGSDICAPYPGAPSGTTSVYRPSAIAERPDTRDLVVAASFRLGGGATGGDTLYQVAIQLGATGLVPHGTVFADFPVFTGETPSSTTSGLLVTADSAMIAGSNRDNGSVGDYDYTLIRTLAGDTIFANQFGGTRSD